MTCAVWHHKDHKDRSGRNELAHLELTESIDIDTFSARTGISSSRIFSSISTTENLHGCLSRLKAPNISRRADFVAVWYIHLCWSLSRLKAPHFPEELHMCWSFHRTKTPHLLWGAEPAVLCAVHVCWLNTPYIFQKSWIDSRVIHPCRSFPRRRTPHLLRRAESATVWSICAVLFPSKPPVWWEELNLWPCDLSSSLYTDKGKLRTSLEL